MGEKRSGTEGESGSRPPRVAQPALFSLSAKAGRAPGRAPVLAREAPARAAGTALPLRARMWRDPCGAGRAGPGSSAGPLAARAGRAGLPRPPPHSALQPSRGALQHLGPAALLGRSPGSPLRSPFPGAVWASPLPRDGCLAGAAAEMPRTICAPLATTSRLPPARAPRLILLYYEGNEGEGARTNQAAGRERARLCGQESGAARGGAIFTSAAGAKGNFPAAPAAPRGGAQVGGTGDRWAGRRGPPRRAAQARLLTLSPSRSSFLQPWNRSPPPQTPPTSPERPGRAAGSRSAPWAERGHARASRRPSGAGLGQQETPPSPGPPRE